MSKKREERCVWCAKKGATEPVGTNGQRIHKECQEAMSKANVKPIPPRRP